jgi:hypothetical protein
MTKKKKKKKKKKKLVTKRNYQRSMQYIGKFQIPVDFGL